MYKYIVVLIMTSILNANNCDAIIEKTRIDFTIKTVRGWVRVCNNNKLKHYLPNELIISDEEIHEVCSCISKLNISTDRSIGNNIGGAR